MRARLLGLAKYVLYPLFYVICLVVGVYASFPWDRVKDRIQAEFAKTQASKGAEAWRLEITSLDGYWLTGIELSGAKITIPPDPDDDPDAKAGGGVTPSKSGPLAKVTGGRKSAVGVDDVGGAAHADDGAADKPKEDEKEAKAKKPRASVILVEHAHARVRLLPLLIGRVRLDFGADVFGGRVHGTVPVGGGELSVELEGIDLSHIAPLANLASVPMKGVASGKLVLTSQGKWSKAAGSFSLTVTEMVMGDGKAKFRNLMPLPQAALGTFEIEGKAEAGVLKLEKFGATGRDLEIIGDGTIKLREPWDSSVADLWVRFGFSDDYKNTDDRTKALFVDDPPFPALISQDRKLKRAKRPDGMWGFHVHGKLGRLRYDPTTKDSPKQKSAPAEPKAAGKDDDDDEPTPAAKATSKRPASPPVKPPGRAGTPRPDGEPAPPAPAPIPNPNPNPDPPADPGGAAEPPPEPDIQPDALPPPEEPAPAPP